MSHMNEKNKDFNKLENWAEQRTPDINLSVETKKKFNTIVEACKESGLDGFDYIYEFFHWDEISELAAYGGFPVRYPHYLFGMEFEHMQQSYTYGYSKIYEMVVNNSPCYAYLLNSNSEIDNLTVVAHAYAHNDFFKNNLWFEPTNRNMINEMAGHGTKIRRYCQKYGRDKVIRFLDLAISIQFLVNPDDVFNGCEYKEVLFEDEMSVEEPRKIKIQKNHEYMEDFINPKDYIKQERKRIKQDFKKKMMKFPEKSTRDVLGFLALHSPRLRNWMRDILFMVREEALYFIPQIQCVVGDTLVSTKNGLIEIDKLITEDGYNKKENDILSIGNKFEKTSHFYKNEVSETIKIKTKSGLELEGTPEHPIQILDSNLNFKMISLRDLKNGDFTVTKIGQEHSFSNKNFIIDFDLEDIKSLKAKHIKCNICGKKVKNMIFHLDFHKISTKEYKAKYPNCKLISDYDLYYRSKDFKYPNIINENIARLFGYYIAEGCWNKNSFTITNNDKNILDDIYKIYKNEFGLEPTTTINKNGCRTLTISNRKFFDFLTCCGLDRNISHKKTVPVSILQSSKNVIKNFLSAFFEGDGCNTTNGQIQCASMSKKLVSQIQHLLFNFGIISIKKEYELSYKYKDEIKRKSYKLIIIQNHYDKFMEEVGFITNRKNTINYKSNISNSSFYVFPYIKENLELLKNNGNNGNYNINGKLIKINIPYTRSKHFGKIDIEKQNNFENIILLDKEIGNKILEVIKQENYYDEIVEINNIHEKKFVYDVTIPSNHIFIANNFVNHNTKILNEGWASFWDEQIMAKQGYAGDSGIIEYAQHHAGVMGNKYSRNPYATGNMLLKWIKEKWDKGRFGPEWESCKDEKQKREWDKKLGLGMEKIFEVRKLYNDYMLIDEFMDQDFCDENEYYLWERNEKGEHILISRDVKVIKPRVLQDVAMQRFPIIEIDDVNTLNLGHLHLKHKWTGLTLNFKYADHVLRFLARLWGRPVVLSTYTISDAYDHKIPMEYNDHITPVTMFYYPGSDKSSAVTWQEYRDFFLGVPDEEKEE